MQTYKCAPVRALELVRARATRARVEQVRIIEVLVARENDRDGAACRSVEGERVPARESACAGARGRGKGKEEEEGELSRHLGRLSKGVAEQTSSGRDG